MLRSSHLAVIALTAVFSTQGSFAQSPTVVERLDVPGPISFQGDVFNLAWSAQPSDTYFKQEYLPDGQTGDSYTQMFIIEMLTGTLTPLQSAQAQMGFLDGRKGSDPVVNYDVMMNDDTGEVMLDFVLSDLSADPVVVEWNAYRYMQTDEGVALYAISRRGYGDEGAKDLLGGLKENRMPAVTALATAELPPVSVQD